MVFIFLAYFTCLSPFVLNGKTISKSFVVKRNRLGLGWYIGG